MSAHWAGASSVNQYSKEAFEFSATVLEFGIICFDVVICCVFKSNILTSLASLSIIRRRTALKTDHFRQHKEHQNLSGLKITHRNVTTSKYFKLSFM
jgi:hypothetical protein